MKKTNKNSCVITRFWPSVEDMKKDLFIDLDKQEIINLSNGQKLKFYSNNKYHIISFKRTKMRVHRLFFYWKHGYLPSLVDHKDRNRSNNNINNLRELDSQGNAMNSGKKIRKNSSSKYKGVTKMGNKWRARIQPFGGKEIHIGCFHLEDDAGQAYNDKIRELSLEEVSVLNDTPQERARKNIQFDPLPSEMNHLKDLFLNIEPLIDFK
jgi:hypothetical protein